MTNYHYVNCEFRSYGNFELRLFLTEHERFRRAHGEISLYWKVVEIDY